MDTHTLISNFLILQKNYQFTRRAMMTKERFLDVAYADKKRGLDTKDEVLKEPLIEHIGHLPIIASYFYEHIEHSSDVDLGRVLIMLSIHDIGETVLGDVFSYTKSTKEELDEVQEARRLLSPSLQIYFDEYEEGETYDAKYAKSIDTLAPLLHAMDFIGYIHTRFLTYGGTNQKIIDKKRKSMMWDNTLLEIFDLCLEQSQRYEDDEELLFPTVDYDLS